MAETETPSLRTENSDAAPRVGPQPFRLSRYFSVVSVIGMGIVIAVMFVLSELSITRTLAKQEAGQNVALARTMLNALWPRYSALVLRADAIAPSDLVDQIENVRLRQEIYHLTRQLNIVKVRIFSLRRQTVFSNWDHEIGIVRSNDAAIEKALTEGPQSELSFERRFEAIDGSVRDRHILETYMAIDHPETGQRQGVIELYTDISADYALAREEQLRIAIVLGLCMLALYVFLMLAVRRAERIMAVQQHALSDSEHRARMLARVVEQSRDSIVTSDLDGVITTWNRGAETIFGYTKEETVGRSMRETILKEASDEEWQARLTRLRTGNTHTIRGWRPTKTGGRVHIVGSSGPLTDDTGRLVGNIAVTHDTTWLERAHEELCRAKEAAEAAARSKSEFLANMSHEIRTPMNGIIGMTNLALDTSLDPEQRDYLTTVKSSADALLQIINDILDLSKIEAGKLSIEAIDFNLRDSLQQTVRVLAVRAHEKRLELIWSVDAAVPDALIGDPLRIRQIILNLVGNAIKFTAEGEVELQVVLEDVRDGQVQLRFRVRDTGIGIPADKCDAIFEAFEQADTSNTRQFGGTGLGLSICRRLVNMMGGSISVSSTEGSGSVFEFSLCIGLQNAERRHHVLLSPADAFVGQAALVVDDNARCRDLLRAYLESWGMHTETCASAGEALTKLATARAAGKPYRLALIDGTLPDADAFRLAADVRTDATSVIMLADSTQGPAIAGARAHCRVHALIKPVSQSTLYDSIAVVLDPALAQLENESAANAPAKMLVPMPRSLDVLLVEDNAVNRKVATRLLEQLGHRVTEAHDGGAAVAMTAAHAYDVILMDMQMPVMDGLDATRAIRAREAGGNRVPIIALTANAMSGDRDRCIEAGMDDYVSKPIEAAALIQALNRTAAYASGIPGADLAEAPTPQASAGAAALPAPAALPYDRAEALMRAADDEELLTQIVDIYLNETPSLVEQVGAFLDAADLERAFRAAHTIKGSSSNLSAHAVSAAARAVELPARNGDVDAARAAYPALQAAAAALIESLATDRAQVGRGELCEACS